MLVHVEFVVDEVALGQVFVWSTLFSPVFIISLIFFTCLIIL